MIEERIIQELEKIFPQNFNCSRLQKILDKMIEFKIAETFGQPRIAIEKKLDQLNGG